MKKENKLSGEISREQNLSENGQRYKLLSILQNGVVLTAEQRDGPRCGAGGAPCPAVVEDGDRFIVVGYTLSKNEVLNLYNQGRVCVDSSKNEVAIEIPRELMMAAIEEMKKNAYESA